MKIIHLGEEMGIGGLPNYVIQLARMQKDPIIAHINPVLGASLETAGLDFRPVQSPDDLRALGGDILHVHLLSDMKWLSALFNLDLPLVRTFHDYTSTCLRRGKRRWPGDRCRRPLDAQCACYGCVIGRPAPGSKIPQLLSLQKKIDERDLYRRFDAQIVGSTHMHNMLLQNGFNPERVHKIPYFSKFWAHATETIDKRRGAGQSRPLEFLFSGQAVTGKGLEILVRALTGLRGDWRLDVYSQGPRLAPAQELAARLGIKDRITFHGWVNHTGLAAAYARADVFIIPSIWDDPGPLVGVEALSFATPVIGFAVGGIPDYVIDGKTGYLVTSITASGLHKALQECLDHPERLGTMGVTGQRLVAAVHGMDKHAGKIWEIYENLLQNRQKRKTS